MLNSSANEDKALAGRRSAFFQTCALLGQYVKEKKALGDLSYEIAGDVHRRGSNEMSGCRTMSLFPVNERPVKAPISGSGCPSLSPQFAFTAPKPNSSGIKSAPMTIFYAGQVIVFNDFPAHKAKEIMDLANQAISQNRNASPPVVATNDGVVMGDSANLVHPTLSLSNKPDQELSSSIVKDLPVARRASLHRFLEKRKDRITAKAPYNKSKPGDSQSKSNPGESDSWLGLAAGPSSLRP